MKITKELINNHTKDTRVGIMLSGGMDSALLLYLMASYMNIDITPFTVIKKDRPDLYVNKIIDWVNNKTGRTIDHSKLIGDPQVPHSKIINTAIEEIDNEYDILYFAGNSYPVDVLPNGPARAKRLDPRHVQPFFYCYKTDIVQAYIDFNLMELLPLTHTCTERSVGRCNRCWQCKERIWAFSQLEISDTTTT